MQLVCQALRLLQLCEIIIWRCIPIRDVVPMMESNMRQAFQATALVVAVSVQMLTFYSVLYA
jgi:hypothetical protein